MMPQQSPARNMTRKAGYILSMARAAMGRSLGILTRRRKIEQYLRSHQVRKLQVGSGPNILQGWLNTDLDPGSNIVILDVRKRFPFDDGTFDYVFNEHLIEHLDYWEGIRFLGECNRILKPGGRIRIATPDLHFLAALCGLQGTDVQKRYIAWAMDRYLPDVRLHEEAFVVNHFVRGFGHKFIYDFKVLAGALAAVGFVGIERCNVGESRDENLRDIESHGRIITDEYNRLEAMVVEAEKPSQAVRVPR